VENQHFIVTVVTLPLAICRKCFNANRLAISSGARTQMPVIVIGCQWLSKIVNVLSQPFRSAVLLSFGQWE
jgi:hypothetical protein